MKRINGYEDYLVTIFGDVYSLKSNKWLKQFNNGYGYSFTNLCKNGKEKTKYVHRLVAKTFIPNQDNKPQVNHKDGNKQNNCIDNLEWVTHSENMKHAFKIGLESNQGIKNGNSKLTENDVLTIHGLCLSEMKQKEIGILFNASRLCIQNIISGKNWKHLIGVE